MAGRPQGAGADLNPELLHQLNFSFVPSRLLSAGVQLAVFSHIAAGKKTAEEVARAARASRRGMRMLLDALAACRLLTKKKSRYGLTPLTAKFLVRRSPNYAGAIMENDGLAETWLHLVKAIRTGKDLISPHEGEVKSCDLLRVEPTSTIATQRALPLAPARAAEAGTCACRMPGCAPGPASSRMCFKEDL